MAIPATHHLSVLLFTDLAGSSALKTRLGDLGYAEKIARPHNALFRQILASIAGAAENNYTGDGFLATFANVGDAVNAALRFQDALRTHPWEAEVPSTRIGVHVGEIVLIEGREDGSMLIASHAADMCARLMSLGRPGQILLTRHAFDDGRQLVRAHPPLAADGEPPPLEWLAHGRYRFKGKDDDPLEVFEVGARGLAPLRPPEDSEKARRVVDADEEELLGWRPAALQEVPSRRGWVLRNKLGVGGFGEVWLAQHAKTGDRRALKFCFDAQRLRSFRRELTLFRVLRETLGDRKDIARLLEVQLDRPPYYLESEYTPDGDIVAWCRAHGGVAALPLATRLELVAGVAEAVAAAHGVGVLHKDLKPSNILVYVADDGTPRARITDFGIGVLTEAARLGGITAAGFTVPDLTENDSSRTGTRMYAPPELLVGHPFTTRGDVFALGVLLYQMVVGDLDRPLAAGWERDLEAALPDAGMRQLVRTDIAEAVDGDHERRLSSAAALAERIRTLDARREARERERRDAEQREAAERRAAAAEARRSRTRRLALAAVAVLLLLLGVAGIFLQRERILREDAEGARGREAAARTKAEEREREATAARAEADLRSRELEQVADFQSEMLARIDRELMGARLREDVLAEAQAAMERARLAAAESSARLAALDRALDGANFTNVAVRSLDRNVLQRALVAIDAKFGDQPLVQASLLQTVAVALSSLGLFDEATEPQERALELRREILGEGDRRTLSSTNFMAALLGQKGRHAEAQAVLEGALKVAREGLRPDDSLTLTILANLGVTLIEQGKLAEAEAYLREDLEARRRAHGDDDLDTLFSRADFAVFLARLGKLADAGEHARAALEGSRRVLGADHDVTLRAQMALGQVLAAEGKYADAERCFVAGLEGRRRILGDDHVDTLGARGALIELYIGTGRHAEAEPQQRAALDACRRLLGPDHPQSVVSLINLAALESELGRLDEAESLTRESLERSRRVLGEAHPEARTSAANLGQVLIRRGKLDEAEPYLRWELEATTRLSGSDHPARFQSECALGDLLWKQGKLAEAEPLYRSATEGLARTLGPAHPTTIRVSTGLASLLAALGKKDEAERVLRSGVDECLRTSGLESEDALRAALELLALLAAQKRYRDAEPYCRAAIEAAGRLPEDDPLRVDAAVWGHNILHRLEKWAELEPCERFLLDRNRRKLGDDHEETAKSMAHLGSVLRKVGKLDESVALTRAAIDRYGKIHGSSHWRTFELHLGLGRAYTYQRKFAEAEKEMLLGEAGVRGAADAPPGLADYWVEPIAELYEAWHAAEPGGGHDRQAAEWRKKVPPEPPR